MTSHENTELESDAQRETVHDPEETAPGEDRRQQEAFDWTNMEPATPSEPFPSASTNGPRLTDQAQQARLRPERSRASTTASNTILKMTADRSTADKMANVVSQLDPEAQAQLEELVGEFDRTRKNRRERPKGHTTPEYQEQNPWHDQEKRPNHSLAEPLPRKDGDADERNNPKVSRGEA